MDRQKESVIYRNPPPASGDYRHREWPIEVEGDREWLMNAKTALKFYEKEQDAKFELVGVYPYTFKPWVIIPRIDERCGDWIHLSFLAKPLKETTDDDDDHHHVEKSKLFFAELVYYNSKEGCTVLHCSTLEPNDPGITYSCGICDPSKKIPHSSKYKLGHWPYQDGEIPDSEFDVECFLEETPGSSKGRQLNLDKLFKGDVPTQYIRMMMKSADFAELALELDKDNRQDAEFELVEPLGFCRRVIGLKVQEWVHVNFTAKPKNDCSNESDNNVSPKLFFAELFSDRLCKYSLVQCSILDPTHPETTYKCRICYPEPKIFHPSEYKAGKRCPKVDLSYADLEMELKEIMDAAYGAMKPTKDGLEDPHDPIHKNRITLSSENVKNLEKGCADLFSGAKAKEFESQGTLQVCDPTHQVCDPMEEMAHPALKVSITD